MMTVGELEILRRSAAMAPLRHEDVNAVIELCIALSRERQQIIDIVSELPANWTAMRETLNNVHRLIGGGPIRPAQRDAAGR